MGISDRNYNSNNDSNNNDNVDSNINNTTSVVTEKAKSAFDSTVEWFSKKENKKTIMYSALVYFALHFVCKR